MTELPNRHLLLEQLKRALLTHARKHRQAALLFIDLDNFKPPNDTPGHETGDLLLRLVAPRLLACVCESDSVARLGGDEFVVMVKDLSEEPLGAAVQAEPVSHKILVAFGSPFELHGREYRSTPSIGVTLCGNRFKEVENLFKQADLALYQARAAGRNMVRTFDQGLQAVPDDRVAMESDRGIDFSLDDFGTGYSSLSYLKRLPLAQLKIDPPFVRDLLRDPNHCAIARTIIALGATPDLALIAEGVETDLQHRFLLKIGCHAFRGYLLGRPVAIGEFDALLQGKAGNL